MASCLGLYVENNIIKYAKVSKEHNELKVEAFGVKVYDDLEKTIAQIIEETYSYKIQIAINLSEENYKYFSLFKLLTKKDIDKSIKTEFEVYCAEEKIVETAFETRYLVIPDVLDKERVKIIFSYQNKIDLNKKIKQFENYKLTGMYPTAMTVSSLLGDNIEKNSLIVNMEEKTTITKIIEKTLYEVETIEQGSSQILHKINSKENSYLKAYEICKNTTIYTSDGKSLQDVETSYLEDIMPTLYEIVGKVMKTVNESEKQIDKIYLTGTLALISNVDLYFQEYLANVTCEIVKPSFIVQAPNINIKDYVEVNTPISIALTELGEGLQGINFKKNTLTERFKNTKKEKNDSEKGTKTGGIDKIFKKLNLQNDLYAPFDFLELAILKIIIGLIVLILVYMYLSNSIYTQITEKISEATAVITSTETQITSMEVVSKNIDSKTTEYNTKISNLEEINERIADVSQSRNMIPNLLNNIMFIIPEGVQLTSIENTTSRHIVIEMQSDQYEQLGYFTAKLKTEAILVDVISSTSEKSGDVIKVTIEGDLP